MGAAAALALLGLALGAPGDVRLETGIRLDGHGRWFSPREGPADRRLEASLVPHATLRLAGPDLRFSATYAPRLRAPDLSRPSDLAFLHAAEASATVRPEGAWRLTAAAQGERGSTDLITESRQVGTQIQTITTTRQLHYQAARVALDLQGRLDPRSTLSVTAGAFVEGAYGSDAGTTLATQRGLRAGAGLAWAATRLDRLSLRADAVGAWLDRGPTSGVLTLDAGWRRRLTRELDGWVNAGAAGSITDPREGPVEHRVYPAAELGLAHTPVAIAPAPPAGGERQAPRPLPVYRMSTQAVVRLSLAIDRVTGAAEPQLQGSLSAAWPVTPRWGLAARASAAGVRQDAGTTRWARLETGGGWAVATRTRLGGGVYVSWQRASNPTLPSFTESGLFLSIGWDAPTIAP